MSDLILTPEFSRLHDWLGLWCMEPLAFDTLVQMIRRIDLAAHMRLAQENPPVIKSSLEMTPANRDGKSVAIVKMTGPMMKSQSSMGGTSTVQLRKDIRAAAANPDVGGILLAIDSPGGTVAGTYDLAAEVKAARRMKPVVAHVDDMAASAAYHVASQAEAIYANSPDAVIGSIGTYVTVYDTSEAAQQQGVKAFHFATGPLKGAGAPGTKFTEEQQAHFQALIDDSQKTFDDAVRRGRGMSASQLADVRSGGLFLAESAIGKKLIDGVQSMSKTISDMQAGLRPKPEPKPKPTMMLAGGLPVARQEFKQP